MIPGTYSDGGHVRGVEGLCGDGRGDELAAGESLGGRVKQSGTGEKCHFISGAGENKTAKLGKEEERKVDRKREARRGLKGEKV